MILFSNLLSFLSQWGTRPYEWSTQCDSNSLVKVCYSSLLTITLHPEVPTVILSNPWLVGGWVRGFYTSAKGVSPNVIVTARLGFELAYFKTAILYFSHYATGMLDGVEVVGQPKLQRSGEYWVPLMYHTHDTDMGNGHKMFVYIIYHMELRNLETRKILTTS